MKTSNLEYFKAETHVNADILLPVENSTSDFISQITIKILQKLCLEFVYKVCMKCKRTESLDLGPHPAFIIMYKQIFTHLSDKEHSYHVKLPGDYSDGSGNNELIPHV